MSSLPEAMKQILLFFTYALICQCSILVKPNALLQCDPTRPTLSGCLRGQECLPIGLFVICIRLLKSATDQAPGAKATLTQTLLTCYCHRIPLIL
jgi:hypothetical protein